MHVINESMTCFLYNILYLFKSGSLLLLSFGNGSSLEVLILFIWDCYIKNLRGAQVSSIYFHNIFLLTDKLLLVIKQDQEFRLDFQPYCLYSQNFFQMAEITACYRLILQIISVRCQCLNSVSRIIIVNF